MLVKYIKINFFFIFSCPFCQKCYAREYLWKRHILVHTEERPYKCPTCDKAFKTKLEVDQHLLTHLPIDER